MKIQGHGHAVISLFRIWLSPGIYLFIAKLSSSPMSASFSFAGLRLALSSLNPSHPHPHPPTRESILQVNSLVTMIQFRTTRCNLTSTNLRELCWAVFSFNFIKPTPNPTKKISLLTQPKCNEPKPRQIDSTIT